MKYLYWAIALILTIPLAFLGIQTLASERVEVVQLHTINEEGEEVTTRLWMVDDEGFQYLRVGVAGSGWFARSQANEEIQLTRNGDTRSYRIVLRQDKSDRINELMQQKYTWGDTFIGYAFGGREGSTPVELHRLQ
ncbi:MAG: hypothetical protein COA96_12880 [SAR86 cluster bacterium]|uniref:Uncharacterized protein n=1 Tax=SAR86 cluster bacterium TaxID=2030880 RepID=A0A2A5AUN1_9GAMM|nr:MAG: hypothetical protein COA96_12880 [SAR86 cluster bacterium]